MNTRLKKTLIGGIAIAGSAIMLAACGGAQPHQGSAPAPSKPAATQPAQHAKPTLAQFNQIHPGMTKAQVETILGPGQRVSGPDAKGDENDAWGQGELPKGGWAIDILYHNGTVDDQQGASEWGLS